MRGAGLLAAASVMLAASAGAQATAGTAGYSRADLQAALREAEGDGKRSAEAATLRARLQNGDFSPGDRVVVELRGDSALFDTLTVRTGPSLRVPNIPDVPLKGVLRSELQGYLTTYLARYIRDPEVRTESLIRLSILGQVGKPGFYDFNSDILLTDAIMAAGGPTGTAALERSTIRRGTNVVLAKERVRRAAQTGATLDRLGLRPGDEISVGEKRQRFDVQTILAITGAAASLALTLFYFARN
jgi:protein involved in polysaccharide export with SLBB domain